MAIERERKFLLGTKPIDLTGWGYEEIEQGYLISNKEEHVRVRKTNEINSFTGRGSVSYSVTYKKVIDEENRIEIDCVTNPLAGKELMEQCSVKLNKTRWWNEINGCTISIDEYKDGLKIIEVESINGSILDIPEWVGKDVTGVKKYNNFELAKKYAN